MARRWPLRSIMECVAPTKYATQIGPFGSALKVEDYRPSGVPLLRGVNVNKGRFHDDDFVFIDAEVADSLSKYEADPGDIILVHRGTLGKIGLIPKDARYPRYLMGNSMLRIRTDASKLLPEYLYYWLSSAEGQHFVFSRAVQVGVPALPTPLKTLRELLLPVPPIHEQEQMVAVLDALDDKIELNRRMNGTLEALAQAVFKEWFVERRPERAEGKAEEGWETMMLDEVANYRNGLALQRFRPKEGEEPLPAIKIAQMRTGLPDSGEWASPNIDPECTVYDGDVVFSWSGSLMAILWCGGKAALNQHLFKVTSDKFPKWFYYLWTQHYMPEFQGIASNKATTMGHINRNHLKVPVPIPPAALLKRGDEVIAPLLDRLVSNNLETRTLTALRDTLLPKLMRGEVRVRSGQASQHTANSDLQEM